MLDTVAADQIHRLHAVIEQVHAHLEGAALAHLPSVASLTNSQLAKATTATIRRKLITVPARVVTSARRITLHLPHAWPWETTWTDLFDRVNDPPTAVTA